MESSHKEFRPIRARADALRRQLDDNSIWVGAGASIAAGYPSTTEIVDLMKSGADDPIQGDESTEVADQFLRSRGPGALRMLLQRALGKPGDPTEFHHGLAALAAAGRVHTIVTTNYDDLIERALSTEHVSYVVQTLEKNVEGVMPPMIRLLKIHGSSQDWENIVLSGESYRRFEQRYRLLTKQLYMLCVQHPLTFVGSSLCEPRVLSWLASLKVSQKNKMLPWRAFLTMKDWERLLDYTWNGQPARNILGPHFRPLILETHEEIASLWSALARDMVVPSGRPVTEGAPPELTAAWPYSNIEDDELGAFVAEATYRSARELTPWFRVRLQPLETQRLLLAEIDARKPPTAGDREERVHVLQNIEHFEVIETAFRRTLEVAVSDELRCKMGWWNRRSTENCRRRTFQQTTQNRSGESAIG